MNVWVPDSPHSGALAELAETVRYGLQHLGVEGPEIIVGPHLTDSAPHGAVLYNTEQVGSPWFTDGYKALLRARTVWDYSAENVKNLAEMGITAKHVPVGYVRELERIPKADEDIDVLFYGSLNARRQKILDDLKAAGLNVVHLFGVYGAERDSYIARAKVVLNMHFYEPGVFEIVRVSYLLTNRKTVVCEKSLDYDLGDAVSIASYDGLVAACFIQAKQVYERWDNFGYEIFKRRPEEPYLEAALAKSETDLLKERYYFACTAGFRLRKPKAPNPFTVVVPVNDENAFNANVRASPGLKEISPHIVGVQGASSAAEALEAGKRDAKTDWILFCHQDVWFPEGTGYELQAILEDMGDNASETFVVGFAGIVNDEHAGFVIDRGWRFDFPIRGTPSSLDEFAILLHKSVSLDANLGWHLWATELCQRYRYQTRIVRVPLFHNSVHGHELPPEFHESGKILAQKYPNRTIKTLCGEIHA